MTGERNEGRHFRRARRRFSEVGLHAPHTLRALVRADEIWLVALAAFVGVGAGLMVAAMTIVSQYIHELLFALNRGQRLSGMVGLDPIRALAVLVAGAYGFTESMPLFLSHPQPAEVVVGRGRAELARPRVDAAALLHGQLTPFD